MQCSHSSITIYYCKLPNSYLAAIAQYGGSYLTRATERQTVNLRRTKKFRMRNTEERIELFVLLAKLLWCLRSGRSHAGYLFNYATNPIHNIVNSDLSESYVNCRVK